MAGNSCRQERYLVIYNGFGVGAAPVWATMDFGLFAKYGLNPDLVMISGSAPGTQALLGGSTHFAQTDGTALIATSMSTKGCSMSWKERAYFKGSAEKAKEPSAS